MLKKFCLLLLLPLAISSCTPRRSMAHRPIVKEVTPPPITQKPEFIIVDAGHGGKDPGTLSTRHDYEEKHLTLSTAHMISRYLNYLGYETEMTRYDDTFVPLSTRAEIANNHKADLFVSIHYNSSPSESADGIEVFYYKETEPSARVLESKALGRKVLSRLIKHTGATSRGVKTGNFAVIRETKMPAVLIEAGFLTNAEERQKLQDPHYRRFIAWGIACGIDEHCRQNRCSP